MRFEIPLPPTAEGALQKRGPTLARLRFRHVRGKDRRPKDRSNQPDVANQCAGFHLDDKRAKPRTMERRGERGGGGYAGKSIRTCARC